MPTAFYIVWCIELLALVSMLAYLRRHRSPAGWVLASILAVAVINDGLPLLHLVPAWMHELKLDLAIFLQWAGYLLLLVILLQGIKKKLAIAALIVYSLTSIGFQGARQFAGIGHHFIPYTVGALFILGCVLLYFHQELVQDRQDRPLITRFYPVTLAGLFVWLAAEVPLMTSIEYMTTHGLQQQLLPFFYTKWVASSLYYLCYPVALLWSMRSS